MIFVRSKLQPTNLLPKSIYLKFTFYLLSQDIIGLQAGMYFTGMYKKWNV
jgi:hypothetical protein